METGHEADKIAKNREKKIPKKSEFIRAKMAWKRMTNAQAFGLTTYVYGVTGYGKTELVTQYLADYQYTYFSCRNGKLYEIDRKIRKNKKQLEVMDEDGNRLQTIVIDDLQFLKESEDKERILSMIRDDEKWVILISRSPLLPWLKTIYMNEGMKQISEGELAWTLRDVGTFFQKHCQMKLTGEQQKEIHSFSQGNPLSIRSICKICEEHGGYDQAYLQQSWHDFEDYLIEQLMQEWSMALIDFLMHMSFIGKFSVPLAEMVTGDTNAYHLIQEALTIGNFMVCNGNGYYSIRPLLQTALQKRARNTYSSEKIREIYYNAGLFYEVQDDILHALEMYETSGNRNRIKEILIRNAERNPGNGHYFELKKYYLSLSEEEIGNDIVLMAGMSMLHSLLLQPEESDKWYDRLKAYASKTDGAERREAISHITYLDIVLPHRGIREIMNAFQSVPQQLFAKGIALPEFSVTSNLPSIMNGGKDFCEWSRRDRELAETRGKEIVSVLGKYGKGLVEIAVAESQYEKGGDDYEIISLLNQGTMKAEAGGALEIVYAARGIQARLNLHHGNESVATGILDSFRRKAESEGAKEIIKNLETQKCRIALLIGKNEEIEAWMETAPEEDLDFFILDRYRYLTKIRCYLYRGEYYRALALLERIIYYAELYERNYIQIESKLLLSIVEYRMQKSEWRETFLQAVKAAQTYRFCRVISEEGQAVWELFQDKEMQKILHETCEDKYLEHLIEETHGMAFYFPMYLNRNPAEQAQISGNALKVLQLMAEGLTNDEMAVKLKVTKGTIKYHCSNIYEKLGVDGKAEAVLAARNLHIL